MLFGLAVSDSHLGIDAERLSRFCGRTRMAPPRGLSRSAMRKNAMANTRGRKKKRVFLAAARREL